MKSKESLGNAITLAALTFGVVLVIVMLNTFGSGDRASRTSIKKSVESPSLHDTATPKDEEPWYHVRYVIDTKIMWYDMYDHHHELMRWSVEDENPPLSIREALKNGDVALQRLISQGIVSKEKRWSLQSVKLVSRSSDRDYWYYCIIYEDAVFQHTVPIIVFMDGSWLTPKPYNEIVSD